jgi:DNA-binding NarL/FixJ family response regulator
MKKDVGIPDIIIADTQLLIIEGLKSLLQGRSNNNYTVCSKYELYKTLRNKTAEILIVDYFLLDFDGFNEIKELRKSYPALKIIILTNNISRNELFEFSNLGIKNILHKNTEKEDLFACLDAVLRGKKYYSSTILDIMLELNEPKDVNNNPVQLTASEVEIVRLIAEGLTNKEIAIRKFLSIHTIMTHRKNILRKLDVSNASELIMYAIKNGIIDAIEYHI